MMQQLDPSYRIIVSARVENVPGKRGKDSSAKLSKLLEQAVYSIDSLLMGCVGLRVIKKVLCPLCMADSGSGPATVGADASGGEVTATDEGEAPAAPPSPAEVPTFCYREVIDSIQSKKKMVCQRGGHEVSVKRAAPDLLLAGVRSIKESELRKEKKIGDGGFGVVYRGSWNRTVVAIKELSRAGERNLVEQGLEVEKNDTQDFKIFDEFRHETFLMSYLEHDNIVKLFGICYEPVSMVMEYVPRGDLHRLLVSTQMAHVACSHPSHDHIKPIGGLSPAPVKLGDVVAIHKDLENHDMCEVVTTHNVRGILPSGCLKRRPPPVSDDRIPWRLRWRIALDVAKGMRYLHSYQPPIVHRDLRSPNIFLASTSTSAPVVAKIGDFGLAQHVNSTLDEALRTWQWLAPEVLSHKRVEYDERSDIYSFAIVLWEIATRQLPYTTEYWDKFQRNGYFQAMDCRNAIVDGTCRPTPPPASSGCPPSFAALMQACWRHNPQERPSFDEIVPTIEAELAKLGTETESRRKGK